MARVLTVQTVRYLNGVDELRLSLNSIGAAVVNARRHGLIGDVTVAHGDASDVALDIGAREEFAALGRDNGFAYEYVFFDENTGSAHGQNLLAEQFPAAWQFVTNPDVVFGGDMLTHLWRRTGDETIGILEARQLPLALPKAYDVDTGITSWASGTCSLVRGDVWREIGGYDDDSFFLYCDDVDMSWRVRMAGYTVVHVPQARVFHDKRLALPGEPALTPHEFHYSAIGAFMMACKWGTAHDVEAVRRNVSGPQYVDVRRAIAERTAQHRLPTPVPGAATVAEFTPDGSFGRKRF